VAVFIKKERLGSAPPRSITSAVERTQAFQVAKVEYAKAKAQKAAELKGKYEGNSEVQRWRTQMTQEERTRDAIERMVPTTKAVGELRNGGKEVSYEEARRSAENLAYLLEKKKAS
jgi:hypothetical protein